MADDDVVLRLLHGEDDADADGPVRRREPGAYCRHVATELDVDARRVYCRSCKAEVDAFSVLLRLSNEWERWQGRLERMRGDAKRAAKQLEELRREERNAKARKRRREVRDG